MPAAPLLRLRNYDYTTPGAYLITFATAGRARSLGRLTGDGVALSSLGRLVADELGRTSELRPGVEVDAAAIMPDHVHFILMLAGPTFGGSSVSQIVNGIKAAVTSRHRRDGDTADRVWQRGFHDRVIRSDRDLGEARRYVLENPAKAWLELMHGAR